jgi:AcrR family transcriptional regulator
MLVAVDAIRGARARARAEITAEITAEARRQLAVDGPTALSLRSVARALGMVSSAVYRYVASRDQLLTLLIVDAYDSLGAAAEEAARSSAGEPPVARWVAVCRAVRAWAHAHPHEYALVYGTPVPGYDAPVDTIGPAARVSLALAGVVGDALRDGHVVVAPAPPIDVPAVLAPELDALREELGLDGGSTEVVARLLAAWTQVFGLVTFELFGQTRNVVTAHAELFDATTALMARAIGLVDQVDGTGGSSRTSSRRRTSSRTSSGLVR